MSELSVNKEVGTTAETLTHNVASQLELTREHWAQSPPHFQDRHRHKTKQRKTKHTTSKIQRTVNSLPMVQDHKHPTAH